MCNSSMESELFYFYTGPSGTSYNRASLQGLEKIKHWDSVQLELQWLKHPGISYQLQSHIFYATHSQSSVPHASESQQDLYMATASPPPRSTQKDRKIIAFQSVLTEISLLSSGKTGGNTIYCFPDVLFFSDSRSSKKSSEIQSLYVHKDGIKVFIAAQEIQVQNIHLNKSQVPEELSK